MALASKMAMEKASISLLWRFPSNLFQSYNCSTSSSATTTTTTTSAGSTIAKRKKNKKNLFEVAQFLPNWGLGYHMAKTHWTNVTYEITKINLYKVFFFPLFKCYFSLGHFVEHLAINSYFMLILHCWLVDLNVEVFGF